MIPEGLRRWCWHQHLTTQSNMAGMYVKELSQCETWCQAVRPQSISLHFNNTLLREFIGPTFTLQDKSSAWTPDKPTTSNHSRGLRGRDPAGQALSRQCWSTAALENRGCLFTASDQPMWGKIQDTPNDLRRVLQTQESKNVVSSAFIAMQCNSQENCPELQTQCRWDSEQSKYVYF